MRWKRGALLAGGGIVILLAGMSIGSSQPPASTVGERVTRTVPTPATELTVTRTVTVQAAAAAAGQHGRAPNGRQQQRSCLRALLDDPHGGRGRHLHARRLCRGQPLPAASR